MKSSYALLIVSVVIVLAGLLAGGIYEGVPTNADSRNASFYLVNRITGAVHYCKLSECRRQRSP